MADGACKPGCVRFGAHAFDCPNIGSVPWLETRSRVARDEEPVAVDWSQPCPAPIRCAIQTHCPPACKAAGNREGNVRG